MTALAPAPDLDLPPGATVLAPQPAPNQQLARQPWPAYPAAQQQQQVQQPAQQQQFQQPQPPAQQPVYAPQPVYQQQPAYQPAPYQPQVQPQYAQPQVYQQPGVPLPSAPQPPPQLGPTRMAPDPLMPPAAGDYQLNDQLPLAGLSGSRVRQPSTPAGPAWQPSPAGAAQQQQLPAQAPQPPAVTMIRDSLSRQGMNVGHYGSDQELLEDLGSSISQVQQLQQLAAIGRQHLAGQQLPQQGQQPVPQPAAQPAAPATVPKTQPPEWRPEWESLVRRDANSGLYVAVDPIAVNPLVVQQANDYARWAREQHGRLLRDPIKALREAGLDDLLKTDREALKKEIRDELAREEQAAQAAAVKRQFVETNKAAFFQLDQQGQPLVNQLTGQPVMTPRGAAAFRYADEFNQQFLATYGMEANPATVTQYVAAKLQADEARGAFGQQPGLVPVPGMPGQLQPNPAYPQQPSLQNQTQYLPPGQQIMQPGQAFAGLSAAQNPAAVNDQLKQHTIQRAIAMNGAQYQPNQGGTIATAAQQAATPQNQHLSFRDMLVARARELGQLPPQYV